MNLEPYLSVSGQPGLFKIVASRSNGMILESFEQKKAKFFSVRKHQFTPLGTVAIYTLEGTESLEQVFQNMKDKFADNPPINPKSEKHQIEEYFESVLPNYDEDKVSIKDMKKVIKWFTCLNEKGILDEKDESKESK